MKKYRKLYPYTCRGCGRKRHSLLFVRANGEMCHPCKKRQPNPDQGTLFPVNEPSL